MLAINFYSGFSILSGYGSPKEWVSDLAEKGADFVAAADKNYQSGLIQFQKACAEHDLPMAVGEEFEVYDSLEKDASFCGVVALYATDEESYRNLVQLNNYAHRKLDDGGGFYYRPRIDLTRLLRFRRAWCACSRLSMRSRSSLSISRSLKGTGLL
jgi:DNA polymerase III, alpha subunit